MKEMLFPEISSLAIDCLSHGRALLTVGGEKPNTMTIGWGSIGYFWNKPVLMVGVISAYFGASRGRKKTNVVSVAV